MYLLDLAKRVFSFEKCEICERFTFSIGINKCSKLGTIIYSGMMYFIVALN